MVQRMPVEHFPCQLNILKRKLGLVSKLTALKQMVGIHRQSWFPFACETPKATIFVYWSEMESGWSYNSFDIKSQWAVIFPSLIVLIIYDLESYWQRLTFYLLFLQIRYLVRCLWMCYFKCKGQRLWRSRWIIKYLVGGAWGIREDEAPWLNSRFWIFLIRS